MQVWNDSEKKQAIIDELEQQGINFEDLKEEIKSDLDIFDLICHIAWDAPALTRKERAENVRKRNYWTKYGEQARKILNALFNELTTYLTQLDAALPEDYAVYVKLHTPHITGLSQHCCIHNSERNFKKLGYRLGHQRLTGTGRSYHQDIGLFPFELIVRGKIVIDPLVMVIYRHRKQLLRPVLTDHVLIEELVYFLWLMLRLDFA